MADTTHPNYIGGEWLGGGAATRNVNPSDLGDVVGEYAQADALQARQAIAAARSALPAWAAVNVQARADLHVPFGGRKASSHGPREQGRYAAEFYTTVKTAYVLAG